MGIYHVEPWKKTSMRGKPKLIKYVELEHHDEELSPMKTFPYRKPHG